MIIPASSLKHHNALTLIELLITLIILSLVLMFGVPSFKSFTLNKRMSSTTDSLENALNYARSNALSASGNIIVCPFSAVGSTSCGNDWSLGWIVVSQSTVNTLLQVQQLTSNDPVVSSSAASITFNGRGFANTGAQFTICDTRGAASAGSVEVTLTGYVQSSVRPGQAVWSGGELTCP